MFNTHPALMLAWYSTAIEFLCPRSYERKVMELSLVRKDVQSLAITSIPNTWLEFWWTTLRFPPSFPSNQDPRAWTVSIHESLQQ